MAASILDQIGGEAALRKLVDRFYDLVETDPRGDNMMRLHFRGHGLSHVREEQFAFPVGLPWRAALLP
jgi:hemoglobin